MIRQLVHMLGNQPLFTVDVEGIGPPPPRVVGFEGVEGISQLYEYRIELACAEDMIGSLIDREALLKIEGLVEPRLVHGYIHNVRYLGRTGAYTRVQAVLAPRLWCLTNRTASRIFQEMSTPDIVLKLLREHGIPARRVRLRLKETYVPRDYCVQYRGRAQPRKIAAEFHAEAAPFPTETRARGRARARAVGRRRSARPGASRPRGAGDPTRPPAPAPP